MASALHPHPLIHAITCKSPAPTGIADSTIAITASRRPVTGRRRPTHSHTATTKITRSEFGLTWNQLLETGGLAVSDDVKISLDVQLVLKA